MNEATAEARHFALPALCRGCRMPHGNAFERLAPKRREGVFSRMLLATRERTATPAVSCRPPRGRPSLSEPFQWSRNARPGGSLASAVRFCASRASNRLAASATLPKWRQKRASVATSHGPQKASARAFLYFFTAVAQEKEGRRIQSREKLWCASFFFGGTGHFLFFFSSESQLTGEGPAAFPSVTERGCRSHLHRTSVAIGSSCPDPRWRLPPTTSGPSMSAGGHGAGVLVEGADAYHHAACYRLQGTREIGLRKLIRCFAFFNML